MSEFTTDELMYVTAGGFAVLLAEPDWFLSSVGAVLFGAMAFLAFYYAFINGDSDE